MLNKIARTSLGYFLIFQGTNAWTPDTNWSLPTDNKLRKVHLHSLTRRGVRISSPDGHILKGPIQIQAEFTVC